MTKKTLFTSITLLVIFSLSAQVAIANADDLVIQEDGKVILVITNNGVLGVTTTKDTSSAVKPAAPPSNPPPQSQSKPPTTSSSPHPSGPTKTIPLVPAHTGGTVEITPPINDDKKIQVTITTKSIQQPVHTTVNSTPQPSRTITSFSPTSQSTPGITPIPMTTNLPTSENVVTKTVDQVVAQGSNGQPVITITSGQSHILTIQQGTTQVTTSLQLQIDTLTHTLSASSNSNKITRISVLPTEALQGVMDKGLLDNKNLNQTKINLINDTNGVNYTLETQRKGKLFGIFDVESPVLVTLSAQSGKVVNISQSILFNIFGRFIQ